VAIQVLLYVFIMPGRTLDSELAEIGGVSGEMCRRSVQIAGAGLRQIDPVDDLAAGEIDRSVGQLLPIDVHQRHQIVEERDRLGRHAGRVAEATQEGDPLLGARGVGAEMV
jgi:hypothetical protein